MDNENKLTAQFLKDALEVHTAWAKGSRGPEMLEIVLEEYESDVPRYIAEIRRLHRLRAAVAPLPTTVQQGWVPVAERLPEETGRYWCYIHEVTDLGNSYYQLNCSYSDRHGFMEDNIGPVRATHWMHLPKPPTPADKCAGCQKGGPNCE